MRNAAHRIRAQRARPAAVMVAMVVAILAVLCGSTSAVEAQENQSGGLDFSVVYQRSTSDRNAIGIGARAMAIDRFPGTVVARFGELAAQVGIDFEGEVLTWMARFELGVGLATDYFSIFLASGIVGDGYQSIDEASEDEDVPAGAGIPITLGVWVRATEWLYFYGMMEPSFVILVEEREVDSFNPFGFGEEFRLRGGAGFEVSGIHFRVDYVWHDVAPVGWHGVSIGAGPTPPDPEDEKTE